MRDRIIKALEAEEISTYTVTEIKKTSVEMFFIRQTLDMTRTEELEEYTVTVYNDAVEEGKRLRGSALCVIHQGMQAEEVRQALREAYYAAGFARNPYYDIVKGCHEEMKRSESSLSSAGLNGAAKLMAEALFEKDTDSNCFVNSAELFVERKEVTIINSRGVDCAYEDYAAKGEFVVQCLTPADVELYQDFFYDNLAPEALSSLVEQKLKTVADRARADKAPKAGKYDILLSEDSVRTVLSFYEERSDAALIFQKYSSYEAGCQVQGETVTGERLNITLHSSAPYSGDGILMKDCEIVKDGVLTKIHGGLRLSQYLGLEPTGEYNKLLVKNGTLSLEDMKKSGRVLHVVSFSDFDMDALSGHFAGEIRLAYLYEDGSVTLLTGGSVNGSLLEAQGSMIFSKERYETGFYSGPYAVLLQNIPVSGEEN